MAKTKSDNLQGSLALLVLKSLEQGPMHGWGITLHIQHISRDVLRVEEGSLYPALHRMEQEGWIASEWGLSENNRRARFYRLTARDADSSRPSARTGKRSRRPSLWFWISELRRDRSTSLAWISRLRALFRRDKLTRDLDEELAFHLSMREQWNVEQGMSRPEAHCDARHRFGNPSVWRERMSEIDLMLLPQTILQDLRYGARTLFRNAGFTTVAILALAIGIGVNTTAFTFFKAVFGRSLDAREPSRMVDISLVRQSGDIEFDFSYPDYQAYRSNLHSFSGVIALSNDRLILSEAGGTPTAVLPLARCWGNWDCFPPALSMRSSPPPTRSPKITSPSLESTPCAAAPSMR